jgi:hypothetical protein
MSTETTSYRLDTKGLHSKKKILYSRHSWAKFKIVLVRKLGRKFYYFMAKFHGSGFSFQSLNQNIKVNSDSKWMFLYKWPMYDYFCPFHAICMFIFHKTEILKVILRCWTGLDYDWCKSYDKKCKYFHFFFFAILYKNTCLRFCVFCVLCHNFCTS